MIHRIQITLTDDQEAALQFELDQRSLNNESVPNIDERIVEIVMTEAIRAEAEHRRKDEEEIAKVLESLTAAERRALIDTVKTER